MALRYLLDTHILLRWMGEVKRLTREQSRVLAEAARRYEPIALSAVSLVEIAILVSDGKLRLDVSLEEFFRDLQADPLVEVLPATYEIALEVGSMGGVLRDPADRVIVATARVHRLRLVTSDQRIIESKLVALVE